MTSFLKVKLPAAIAILALACYVVFLEVEASQESDERFGATAVWNRSDKDIRQINDDCRHGDAADYSQCFIDSMAEMGASSEALDFTQEYAQEHDGTLAILRDFQPMDVVDAGYALLPDGNRAEHNHLLLLNGTPEIVDTGDVKKLPEEQLVQDPQFARLRHEHPQIAIFAGNDDSLPGPAPAVIKLPDGGQKFLIEYPLRNGCTFCTLLGHATFSFVFRPTGQFHGIGLVKVEAQSAPAARQ